MLTTNTWVVPLVLQIYNFIHEEKKQHIGFIRLRLVFLQVIPCFGLIFVFFSVGCLLWGGGWVVCKSSVIQSFKITTFSVLRHRCSLFDILNEKLRLLDGKLG